MDIAITFFLLLAVAFLVFFKAKKVETDQSFFDKNYTTAIKGICAIVVIFVHFPPSMQNPLQDAVGSFAYIAVTFFFLVSAFGMHYSLLRTPEYLSNFWVGRLSALIIPNLFVNIVTYILSMLRFGKMPSWQLLICINHYVVILLEYCLLFYVLAWALRKGFIRSRGLFDILLIIGVTASSLIIYLCNEDNVVSAQLGWCFERMGLVWGILLYRFFDTFKQWMASSAMRKIMIFGLSSAILGGAYLTFKDVWFWCEYLVKIMLGLSILILVFLCTSRVVVTSRFSKILGGISFEIYLSHGAITYLIIGLFPSLTSGVAIASTIVATICISYVIHLFDAPLVKFCRKICQFRHKQLI